MAIRGVLVRDERQAGGRSRKEFERGGGGRHRWPALAALLERSWAHDPVSRPCAEDAVKTLDACIASASAGLGRRLPCRCM